MADPIHLAFPESSRYYRPEMDAERLRYYLDSDTSTPAEWQDLPLNCISIANGTAIWEALGPEPKRIHDMLDAEARAPSRMKIILMRQIRQYEPFKETSSSTIQLRHDLWRSLLERLHILPSFLEFLHSNHHVSGGSLSFAHDTKLAKKKPTAFHICVKAGRWSQKELAVYARHDFETNTDLLLVIGLSSGELPICPQRLTQALTAFPRPDIFSALLYIVSTWFQEVENRRKDLDFRTQKLESRTGFGGLRHPADAGHRPVPLEQLEFSKDLQNQFDRLRQLSWGSRAVGQIFSTVTEQVAAFDNACTSWPEQRLSEECRSNLESALAHKVMSAQNQFLQIDALKARVDSQIAVTKTLITHRDLQSNLELARATKRDAWLMRGIAVVTMIFLPATSVATFFSMVFFHMSDRDSNLDVSKFIWLYPAVTIPLTLLITFWYSWWSSWYWGVGKILGYLGYSRSRCASPLAEVELGEASRW